MEQAVSASRQLMTLPLKVIREKEGEMEDNTEQIIQVVQVVTKLSYREAELAALHEKLYEVEEEKEQVSDCLTNIHELQCREVELSWEAALLRGFIEARNNAHKYRMEQEASAGNQLKILPLKVVGKKEGEMEDNAEQSVQVVQAVRLVQSKYLKLLQKAGNQLKVSRKNLVKKVMELMEVIKDYTVLRGAMLRKDVPHPKMKRRIVQAVRRVQVVQIFQLAGSVSHVVNSLPSSGPSPSRGARPNP